MPSEPCPLCGLSRLRQLTPEEAERAYEEAVPVPLSDERIQEIVDYATREPAPPPGGTPEGGYAITVNLAHENAALRARIAELESGRGDGGTPEGVAKEDGPVVRIANRILDTPYKDPDDDESFLARQFLRHVEALAKARAEAATLREERGRIIDAVQVHHEQKADDRCWMDDDRVYSACGFPPADTRVGDKAAMLENCKRFLETRCKGGNWPSYAQLESQLSIALADAAGWRQCFADKDKELAAMTAKWREMEAERDMERDVFARDKADLEKVICILGPSRDQLRADRDALVPAVEFLFDRYDWKSWEELHAARAVLDRIGAAPEGTK